MKLKPELYWVIPMLVAGCASAGAETAAAPETPAPTAASVAAAAPAPAAGGAATTLDGVYTAAQADRGGDTARTVCFACHSEAEWSRPPFLRGWNGRPVTALVDLIQATMPYDSPGSLSAQEYVDLVAYMLEIGGVPAGDIELPADDARLSQIDFASPN